MVFRNVFTCSFFLFLMSILFSCCVCHGSDRILRGQSLLRNQTIISKGGRFELGFFNPGNSSNYYVGIWYKNIPVRTIVWVANRNKPISQSMYNDSRLQLSKNGNLQLVVLSKIIWDVETSNGTEAVILNTGNFVMQNSSDIFIWQSFEHPTDTWLPGGKIGYNSFTSEDVNYFSWKNRDDPSTGNYSLVKEYGEDGEVLIQLNDSQKVWRSGIWRDGAFTSLSNNLYSSNYFNIASENIASEDEFSDYLVFNASDESMNSRIVIDNVGIVRYLLWSEAIKKWDILWVQPSDSCTNHGFCGVNAICKSHPFPNCSCLTGFTPHDAQKWDDLNFSGGCKRRTPMCKGKNDFRKLSNITLPANGEFVKVTGFKLCKHKCRANCTCNAFAYSTELGCVIFVWDLLGLARAPNNSAGTDLYIRMDTQSSRGLPTIGLVLIMLAGAVILICSIIYLCWWKHKTKVSQPEAHQDLLLLDLNSDGSENSKGPGDRTNSPGEEINNKYELPTFSFSSIAAATNDFSLTHKLGEGGFGPVYKGELLNGQFVAVKRLSKRSGQGLEEFKNEMELIAKLQHRNLVRILGCCIENDEKILVYEYMANKSLDFFLFDPTWKELLDWERRFHIIEGIAQGLLYLHHYSRLRIVHRDLKVSNILLDAEMNPKISDFGMARIFGGSDSQANTRRIVGTYGYMSPEYAMEGVFSIKSDVYAFGVLLLEIISGKKNTGFYGSDHLNLLGYAWNLWTNNRGLELIDPALKLQYSSSSSIPLRYIQIGLLCVQDDPGDRPMMSDVVAMLNKEASPQRPTFPVGRTLRKASSGENDDVEMCSINDITVSLIEAR